MRPVSHYYLCCPENNPIKHLSVVNLCFKRHTDNLLSVSGQSFTETQFLTQTASQNGNINGNIWQFYEVMLSQ